jgi:hypothetical protein
MLVSPNKKAQTRFAGKLPICITPAASAPTVQTSTAGYALEQLQKGATQLHAEPSLPALNRLATPTVMCLCCTYPIVSPCLQWHALLKSKPA